MADRTAAARVSRYRAAHRKRGGRRIELFAPQWAVVSLRATAERLRNKNRRLEGARLVLEAVLTTVNAPRPRHMDPETLLACLASPVLLPEWEAHIKSLFEEVSIEALHRTVLTGVVDFEDLAWATRVWRIRNGETSEWVREMADLRLARPAPRNVCAD